MRRRPQVLFLVGVLLLLLLSVGVWRWQRRADAGAHAEQAAPIATRREKAAPGATATSIRTAAPAGVARIVEENAVPGRMVFLDFTVNQHGLAIAGASGAKGRVKPLPVQHGLGWLEFEVFDGEGRRTYAGSAPDPIVRYFEHPAGEGTDRIATTVIAGTEGVLSLRVPGESRAARIVVWRPAETGRRDILGDFNLRPAL